MIKLVLCDLDNTLVPSGQGHVSYRALTAIRSLRALGVRFGPATGRDAFELDPLFFGARDCFATGIVANGKRIFVDGELRRHFLLDNDALRQLAALLDEVPNAFLTLSAFDNPRGEKPYWSVGARAGDLAWFERFIGFVGEELSAVPDDELISATIACSGAQEQLDEILARTRALRLGFDYVQPCPHWCDILPAGLNKGTALQLLLDELGITADEVLFFGDADNDVTLLSSVGHSVAVANATPAAAAAARYHIGASADDAVAEALEELARALQRGETPRFMQEAYQVTPTCQKAEEAESSDDEAMAEALRSLALAQAAPELGGEAGATGGAGGDAPQL